MSDERTDCGNCIDRIVEFLDSDFDPALAADLSAHLDECGGCSKARVEDELVRKVRDCTKSRAPAELRDRIIEHIRPTT